MPFEIIEREEMRKPDEIRKNHVMLLWGKLPEYCAMIEKKYRVVLSPFDVLLAMAEATGSDLSEFALQNWTPEKIMKLIKTTKIMEEAIVIEEEIELPASAIPINTIHGLYEETVRHRGERWIIHKNDSDHFPSSPHAHNYETGLKLHLGTGELFQCTTCVGRIKRTALLEIRQRFKRIMLPELDV